MSLALLRSVRLAGMRPQSVVVIIGHADTNDDETVVQIGEEPHHVDLRPLIGMAVHVIDLQDDPARTLRVIEALEALKVKPLGICGPAGACGVSPGHEEAMQAYRRALCRC